MTNTLACLIFFLTLQLIGCSGNHAPPAVGTQTETSQRNNEASTDSSHSSVSKETPDLALDFQSDAKLGSVVRTIFQDSEGVLWIGGEGSLFRIDSKAVTSYDLKDDHGEGVTVKQIVQTADGAIWCGTTGGLSKIEDESFRSYGEKDGLISRDVWSLAADRKGTLWVGTIDGACRFDGNSFQKVEIPKSSPDPTRGVTSAEIVHCIMVDSRDRVWFGTNGGAYVLEGTDLTLISQKNGLPGTVVHNIMEAADGHIWIGTTHHGICRFDGQDSINFTADGTIEGNEIWCISEDQKGNVWFSGKNFGIYRYDGMEFERFDRTNGIDSPGVMCIFEDSAKRLWFGGVGGLFRYQGGEFIKVTEKGPWK